jgi:hypothetical protein
MVGIVLTTKILEKSNSKFKIQKRSDFGKKLLLEVKKGQKSPNLRKNGQGRANNNLLNHHN